MTAKHSEAFIEQALVKAYSRGARTIKSVAQDLNVSYHTLKYWMKNKAFTKSGTPAAREKRPQDHRYLHKFAREMLKLRGMDKRQSIWSRGWRGGMRSL